MTKRKIIKIDETKCNGCGDCIPNCHEGALQIIDGKARLISDLKCDGLGACIGHCPQGAISLEEREAAPYDEIAVIREMMQKGKNTVIAHLKHLKSHGETELLNQGINYLWEHQRDVDFSINEVSEQVYGPVSSSPAEETMEKMQGMGCPGSMAKTFDPSPAPDEPVKGKEQPSQLAHWPIQMHLINPGAGYFKEANLLLAADCVAYALGDFHSTYLKGKSLCIACPKLDSNKEVYVEKLIQLIDEARVDTITVMKMEVPCCGGLLALVQEAASQAQRKVPVKNITVSVKGAIQENEWI